MKAREPISRPKREVTLVPVFRYGEELTHGRTWLWLTGAAVLVAVAVSVLLQRIT
jgi:hypothetical protein